MPAYPSSELRLEVVWGDLNLVADWIGDEFWSVSSELPTETEELFTVTYFDNFGAIELARYSQQFRTSSNPTDAFQVSADQFVTDQFDNDGDGVSNIDELISYTANFSTTITLIDESTRSYVEETTRASVGTYNFNSKIRSNLTGRLIDGGAVCEPIAGTYYSKQTSNINGGRLSETSVSKDMSEPYWRVSRVFNSYYENNELVTTEYFARELNMDAGDGIEQNGFICDSVD